MLFSVRRGSTALLYWKQYSCCRKKKITKKLGGGNRIGLYYGRRAPSAVLTMVMNFAKEGRDRNIITHTLAPGIRYPEQAPEMLRHNGSKAVGTIVFGVGRLFDISFGRLSDLDTSRCLIHFFFRFCIRRSDGKCALYVPKWCTEYTLFFSVF